MKKVLMWLITFYRRNISPAKAPCCRFSPTCSAYALEAVGRYGALRGLWLALKRFLRCNPLFKGGWDPVPELKKQGGSFSLQPGLTERRNRR